MAALGNAGEAHWYRFLSRWALFAGIAELVLLVLAILWFLPATQDSPLAEEYGELVAASSNPTLYRLLVVFDIAVWVALGGFFITLGVILASRAPVRGTLLAACGVGQIAGVLGAFTRLEGMSSVAERYVELDRDQEAVLESYLNLQAVISSQFNAGALLWSVAFLLVAWVGLTMTEFPRWLVILIAILGLVAIIDIILYFLSGDFYLDLLKFPLLPIVFFAVAVAFWRGPRSRVRHAGR